LFLFTFLFSFFLSSYCFYLFSSPFFLFLFPLTLSLSHRPLHHPHHSRAPHTAARPAFLADPPPPRKPASLTGPSACHLRRLRWLRRPADSAAGWASRHSRRRGSPFSHAALHCPAPPPSSSSAPSVAPSSSTASRHRPELLQCPVPPLTAYSSRPPRGRLGNGRAKLPFCNFAPAKPLDRAGIPGGRDGIRH
jgi:hypothetical protein